MREITEAELHDNEDFGETMPPQHDQPPFYWEPPPRLLAAGAWCAPSGWYQWTRRGLVYLGETLRG